MVTTGCNGKALSLAEYAEALAITGTHTLSGSGASFWASSERGAIVRLPTFHLAPPAPGEVRRILWHKRAAVVSYIVDPDEHHPANAWLYVCRDPSYSFDKLSKPAQRCIRRAQRSLRFSPIELPTLLDQGYSAYQDTVTRVGLAVDTSEQFKRGFESFHRNPAHRFVGAWKDDILVAFMMLIMVDDWMEIPGSFSTDAHLDLRPNDGLMNYVLDHFLVQRSIRIVCYGLSSVQEDADKIGLHAFKKKVGFEALPVHRAFVLHPLLRPFANRLVLWGARRALRFYPEGRLLRKAGGVLTSVLREKEMPEAPRG